MSDYIDRAALGIGLCNRDVFENKGYADGWNAAVKILKEAPVADVQEIKHGEWIEDGYYDIPCVCSCCGSEHKKQGPHLYTYSADVAPVLPISHIHLWFLLLSLLQPVRQVWDSVFDLCPCSLQGFELAIFQLRTFIQQVVCGPVQLGSFLQ